ncbi:MAG: hypothetical protein LC660_06345, partial [Desulfobacteraceae bacterium]|nr:hypothetical protein [Desulfobacteraceae bacterium]
VYQCHIKPLSQNRANCNYNFQNTPKNAVLISLDAVFCNMSLNVSCCKPNPIILIMLFQQVCVTVAGENNQLQTGKRCRIQ